MYVYVTKFGLILNLNTDLMHEIHSFKEYILSLRYCLGVRDIAVTQIAKVSTSQTLYSSEREADDRQVLTQCV